VTYQQLVTDHSRDPEQLEQAYRAAVKAGQGDAFRQAIDAGRASQPDNLLYAAWHYRLRDVAVAVKTSFVRWGWAVPLALLNGLLFWWLSDEERYSIQIAGGPPGASTFLPTLLLLVAPLAAVFVLAYLAPVRRRWPLAVLIGVGLVAAAGYVLWVYPRLGTRSFQEQYVTLMAMHLPLLAWAGVGLYLVAGHRDPGNRFAFLIKSLEVVIMGGLFAIAGGLFTGITIALFSALGMEPSELVMRLFIAGGGGLIPVIAVAVIYNAARPPAGQSFEDGLSKLLATLMRTLLPLTLVVLVVYIGFVLLNFREPFENRDVLIIYNGMLFAVIALLVGATPVSLAETSPRVANALRWAIVAVAGLALLVSVYALAAIVYRTAMDRLTPNRLAFIGWNVVNIGLLALVVWAGARGRATDWLPRLHRAFAIGTVAYTVWTLAVILVVPWLFGIDQGALDTLPPAVRAVVYESPDPILLKCAGSPHIYLLDGGEKRWIDTIATLTERGYVWDDVSIVPCDELRILPDGEPIPADAGPPPQP